MFLALLHEVVKQGIHSLIFKRVIPNRDTTDRRLAVRLLNKLAYSLFFKNIFMEQYAHLKALNMADQLGDCAEKAEAYSCHSVASIMSLLKRRAFKYMDKAIAIAKRANRKDMLAFAHSFGGVTYYYNAEWDKAEKSLLDSIELYKGIGDHWGQIVPLETMAYGELRKGSISKCKTIAENMEILDEECNDQRGLALAHVFTIYIKHLEGKDSHRDWDQVIKEREGLLKNIPMNKAISNSFILKKLIYTNELQSAYNLSDSTLENIKLNNLIQEYIADAFSDRCEILISEYHNRKVAGKTAQQLPHSDDALLKELKKFCVSAWKRGIMYPAHRGAALRARGWYNLFKGRKRRAGKLFMKAAARHHALAMSYEEAKSLRDLGYYYEYCHKPGIGRDYFTKAYLCFEGCGAIVESDRLCLKVEPAVVKDRKRRPDRQPVHGNGQSGSSESIRIDALHEASLSLLKADNIVAMAGQLVSQLIKITGAKQGCLHLLKEGKHESVTLALDHDGKPLAADAIAVPVKLHDEARLKKTAAVWPGHGVARDGGIEGSAMCIPLINGKRLLGSVYLENRLVGDLFTDHAIKAAQILSARQAFSSRMPASRTTPIGLPPNLRRRSGSRLTISTISMRSLPWRTCGSWNRNACGISCRAPSCTISRITCRPLPDACV